MCYNWSSIEQVVLSNAPVAQLDRVFDYESKGHKFESCRAHHLWQSIDRSEMNGLFAFYDLDLPVLSFPGRIKIGQ